MEEDKVFKESKFSGEPSVNRKELEKENNLFLDNSTEELEQRKILYNKVVRIEKTVYYLMIEVAIIFVLILFNLFS